MHSGSTYCVCHSRLLKHPLQAIKWDVKPLNPLSCLQVFSTRWIVWCLYLRPRGTTGNEARGRRHCARHLLSISWLNFHCCRETVSPSPLFPSGWCLEGKSIVRGEPGGVRKWEREKRVRNRDGDAGVAGVPLCLGGSPGCAGTWSGWRKEEEKRKSSQGKFFSSLPCPVITHTHTEAYVNSHAGSEKQIEIWVVLAGQRSDDKGKEKKRVAAREKRRKEEREVLLIL